MKKKNKKKKRKNCGGPLDPFILASDRVFAYMNTDYIIIKLWSISQGPRILWSISQRSKDTLEYFSDRGEHSGGMGGRPDRISL